MGRGKGEGDTLNLFHLSLTHSSGGRMTLRHSLYAGENGKSYAIVFIKVGSYCILHFGMLENRDTAEGGKPACPVRPTGGHRSGRDEKSLSHTLWERKYHVVWILKK